MNLQLAAGSTAQKLIVFVKITDTSTVDGRPLVGLTSASGFIGAIKVGSGSASSPLSIGDVTTLGTYAGGSLVAAIKEVDQDYMPGVYELHLPLEITNVPAGEFVHLSLWGATNASPVELDIQVMPRVELGSYGLDYVSTQDSLSTTDFNALTFRERLLFTTMWALGSRKDDDGSVSGVKKLTLWGNLGTGGDGPLFEWAYAKSDGVTQIELPMLHIY